MNLRKIVSGGQTGADRAALDFALEHGIETGGYVPKGRMAEDGPLPPRYPNLIETASDDPAERTKLNVTHSDGTLIVCRGEIRGGTALTADLARELDRPHIVLDLEQCSVSEAARLATAWLNQDDIRVLNVAGPRASEDAQIYVLTRDLLSEIFGR